MLDVVGWWESVGKFGCGVGWKSMIYIDVLCNRLLFDLLLHTSPREQDVLFENESLLWESLMLRLPVHASAKCSHIRKLTRLLHPAITFHRLQGS